MSTLAVIVVLASIVSCTAGSSADPSTSGQGSGSLPTTSVDASDATHLAQAPTDCPSSSPLLQRASPWGSLFGAPPVLGVFYARLDAPSGSFHVGHNTRKDNGGWVVKVLWVMEPGTVQPVTITGHELDTGSAITFDPSNGSPSQTFTLDPDHPGTSSRRKGWTEYPSTLAFPEAGCYVVEATWADGSWQRVFGFGR